MYFTISKIRYEYLQNRFSGVCFFFFFAKALKRLNLNSCALYTKALIETVLLNKKFIVSLTYESNNTLCSNILSRRSRRIPTRSQSTSGFYYFFEDHVILSDTRKTAVRLPVFVELVKTLMVIIIIKPIYIIIISGGR